MQALSDHLLSIALEAWERDQFQGNRNPNRAETLAAKGVVGDYAVTDPFLSGSNAADPCA